MSSEGAVDHVVTGACERKGLIDLTAAYASAAFAPESLGSPFLRFLERLEITFGTIETGPAIRGNNIASAPWQLPATPMQMYDLQMDMFCKGHTLLKHLYYLHFRPSSDLNSTMLEGQTMIETRHYLSDSFESDAFLAIR
ncbi:hypothetical protein FVE85_1615 [Porphyridium purpureum]|uniref:Uncharacterized protein n=1 Tax=Porphyridium purpureum TaxID=35688 RepID=A0A5J4YWX0_PORPP|nr:hypothetical protein FVE85_1615 [Porphyridium purpureum]|eukprot:POR6989..scf209_3